jgi:hypothetical protein
MASLGDIQKQHVQNGNTSVDRHVKTVQGMGYVSGDYGLSLLLTKIGGFGVFWVHL